ncbi:SCO2322 family protein [Streptomyces sp. NPDC053755]|uniref:SCO2322 family protein n=1 Tax=Streptomyces sp. NPDC053755 TaxID=3155815 RepID=UPI003432C0AC
MAAVLTAAAAGPAQAAGYRYWSFWEGEGADRWTYASLGPATARPGDGEAIGFRFAVSQDTKDATRPSAAPDFAAVCSGTPEKRGTKRVAVVVDFGGPSDAPPGETPPVPALTVGCAQVREDATGAEALAAVAKPLRYDSAAMLCGIAGYPAKGCGEQVAQTEPSGTAKPDGRGPTATAAGDGGEDGDGGPALGIAAGGAAVLVLGGAAVWKARRRA